MTVGVISAQKKMLKLLTAWEENMPMMEKAIEKFLFSVPVLSEDTKQETHTYGFVLCQKKKKRHNSVLKNLNTFLCLTDDIAVFQCC